MVSSQGPAVRGIHSEQSCCGTSDCGAALDFVIHAFEVIVPEILPRVEKRCQRPGEWIDGCEIGAFVAIAEMACEREVVRTRFSAVLARDDVIDMEAEERLIMLGEAAILAACLGPFFDPLAELRSKLVHGAWWESTRRASAWRMAMTLAA